MTRVLYALGLLLLAVACDPYKEYPRLVNQDGLTAADQFARYNHEAAQKVAIGRKFADAYQGDTPEDFVRQAAVAMDYARTLPGVADVQADPLGHWLSIRFDSGWRAAVLPIDDGTRAEAGRDAAPR